MTNRQDGCFAIGGEAAERVAVDPGDDAEMDSVEVDGLAAFRAARVVAGAQVVTAGGADSAVGVEGGSVRRRRHWLVGGSRLHRTYLYRAGARGWV